MTLVFQAILDIIGSLTDLSFLSFLITLQGKCAYDKLDAPHHQREFRHSKKLIIEYVHLLKDLHFQK